VAPTQLPDYTQLIHCSFPSGTRRSGRQRQTISQNCSKTSSRRRGNVAAARTRVRNKARNRKTRGDPSVSTWRRRRRARPKCVQQEKERAQPAGWRRRATGYARSSCRWSTGSISCTRRSEPSLSRNRSRSRPDASPAAGAGGANQTFPAAGRNGANRWSPRGRGYGARDESPAARGEGANCSSIDQTKAAEVLNGHRDALAEQIKRPKRLRSRVPEMPYNWETDEGNGRT
jgi:hypothetical protein